MANPEHAGMIRKGVTDWNEWLEDNPFIDPDLSGMNLNGAYLDGAQLAMTNLRNSDLSYASLHRACLSAAHLRGADLGHAKITGADLEAANLEKANLSYADLQGSIMLGCNLTGATLTGARLYGTARDGWLIKGVECKYVYWDLIILGQIGDKRSPKDRDLEPGEFELLYAALPTIEYVFDEGMTPIDPLIMDRVVQAIRKEQPEFDIKIDSINARGLAPSIKFTVQQNEHKEPALQQVQKEYEIKLKQLESERDRYYHLLARALDAPKEVKLINAAPGSIVATNGSTVNVEQHIHNALDLQKTIAAEPEDSESFAKVAKKTALDIVGEAIKDIAKGQVKEAAKQIIELGKDLGPLLVRTAAYVFFSNVGT